MQTPNSFILMSLFWGIVISAPAQELLKLDFSNRCIFYPSGQEEELYSFRNKTQDVQQLITEILQLGGDLEQNFMLIQANVENVSAVVDSQNRYILWNLDFWENTTPLMRLASFAHEIGHQANLHHLTPAYGEIEEKEADEFTGFVLGMKNIPPRTLSVEFQSIIFSKSTYDRMSVILQGYAKAAKTLKISALAFEDDPSWTEFQKAAFPFPPPECYQATKLDRYQSFYDCQTLGDVAKRVGFAFGLKGYPYRFMSVPEGFAVVTQLEQYQFDGSIQSETSTRWQELPPAENFALSLQYLKSLILPRKSYLRVFAVVVTKRSYPSNEKRISKDAAKAWISKGLNRLPKSIADQPYHRGYEADVLVYEFEVPETTFKPWQHCPCHLDAREHLRKTGLGYWLK